MCAWVNTHGVLVRAHAGEREFRSVGIPTSVPADPLWDVEGESHAVPLAGIRERAVSGVRAAES